MCRPDIACVHLASIRTSAPSAESVRRQAEKTRPAVRLARRLMPPDTSRAQWPPPSGHEGISRLVPPLLDWISRSLAGRGARQMPRTRPRSFARQVVDSQHPLPPHGVGLPSRGLRYSGGSPVPTGCESRALSAQRRSPARATRNANRSGSSVRCLSEAPPMGGRDWCHGDRRGGPAGLHLSGLRHRRGQTRA